MPFIRSFTDGEILTAGSMNNTLMFYNITKPLVDLASGLSNTVSINATATLPETIVASTFTISGGVTATAGSHFQLIIAGSVNINGALNAIGVGALGGAAGAVGARGRFPGSAGGAQATNGTGPGGLGDFLSGGAAGGSRTAASAGSLDIDAFRSLIGEFQTASPFIFNRKAGAGGGGGGATVVGGPGGGLVAIICDALTIAGSVLVNGSPALNESEGGGGGGAAGAVLIFARTGIAGTGIVNANGGLGGSGTNGGGGAGGNGGLIAIWRPSSVTTTFTTNVLGGSPGLSTPATSGSAGNAGSVVTITW